MEALEPRDPRAVGRYRLLARLGAGGMAIVYFGRSPGRRAAAVKVMHTDLAADPAYRERFRREVAASRAVGGRYCPAVLDADVDAGAPWLATEFLPAVSLRDVVRRHGPLPAGAVWPLGAGIAEALASVHRAGIVHLDVKPANVLLTAEGPRLIDLGIAAEVGAAPPDAPAGTWGFMSPEQVAGAVVGPPSDVYSLGATLAYAATGSRDASAIADGRLATVVADCLRPDAGSRPPVADLLAHLASMTAATGGPWPPAAVRADLDRRVGEARNPPVPLPVPSGPPGSARRRTVLLAGGLVAVGGGAAALVLVPDDATVTGPATPEPSSAPPASSAPPSARTRTLEIYAYGRTTVKTLTTVVNGQAETVHDAALPYRRTVQVPLAPRSSSWRVAYHCGSGLFNFVVSVDGSQVGGGGRASNGPDMTEDTGGEA